MNWEGSLGLVDEEGDLLVIEVQEMIFLVGCVAAETIAHEHVPERTELAIQELLQVLCDLRMLL